MHKAKPVYLFAGGHWNNPASMLGDLKRIFPETGKEKPIVASIGTANGDSAMFYRFTAGLFKKAGAVTKKVLLAKEKADTGKARALLEEADIIFMSGGDVEEGMRWLNIHGMEGFLRELYAKGKLFFGISAGSIMLGEKWVRWSDPDDDATAGLFDCLGIAPVICDTHSEKDEWEELKAAVALSAEGTRGYGIPASGILRVGPDGSLGWRVKPAAVYANKGGRAREGPELPEAE